MSEWAERFRYLSREYSASPGRYSLTNVPYAREPMDCACDSTVRVTVLKWGSQLTKTTVLENVLGFSISHEPGPLLLVQPTVDMAQAWSKERFNATVRDTPVLRDVIADHKSRSDGNTIQLKTFPGGNLAIIGANAPSGLAGRPRRVVLCDEVDRYPASAGTEGDPVSLAIRRTESFYNAVVYLTSTPTIKGTSRVESEYEQTDKRLWFCPCPKCGKYQPLVWSGVKWEKENLEGAWYQCESCEAHWTDADRVAAIRAGEWRATAPFNGKRGYFLNGIYSPFKAKRGFKSRIHQMVVEFLEAKAGGVEMLKTWTNTFLAETWEDASERIEPSALESRLEDYTPETLPDDVVFVFGGADVQKDRIELEWCGLGADDETWGIEALKVFGDTERPETWTMFGNQLKRIFKRRDGVELEPTALAIDFHFKPSIVKRFSISHGTKCMVFPVIGVGTTRQPNSVQHRMAQDGLHYWTIATDPIKDMIFSRLRITEPGPRYVHLPRGYGYDDEWFRQLTSERVVTKYTKGFPKRIYEKSAGARNEALDMRVYGLAVVQIMNPQIEAIRRGLLNKPKPQPQQVSPALRNEPADWVNGWR